MSSHFERILLRTTFENLFAASDTVAANSSTDHKMGRAIHPRFCAQSWAKKNSFTR